MTRPTQRKVPMQVLSFGPPRTATVSTQKALERLLDAPVYHGYIAADNIPRGKYWLHPVEAKYEGKGKQYGRK
ncbi:hypothetical protein Slin15195_G087450 [Septoria linicola]|uniref:Uncharacterized protein n=1 Tax=Septoria linicola TaxID=215465 RepID=A0A9Q9EL43_9PEZI|nr:hypothetical protein Slin14017_G090040 [Septoria linicola]USW55426.1 hypothetical protein Slin15195_G087450 [Septoria linicola]